MNRMLNIRYLNLFIFSFELGDHGVLIIFGPVMFIQYKIFRTQFIIPLKRGWFAILN